MPERQRAPAEASNRSVTEPDGALPSCAGQARPPDAPSTCPARHERQASPFAGGVFLSAAGAADLRTGPWGPPCCEPQLRTGDAPARRAVGRPLRRLGSGRALGHVSVASGIAGDALRDGLFVFRGKTQAGLKGRRGCPGGKIGAWCFSPSRQLCTRGENPDTKNAPVSGVEALCARGKADGVSANGSFSGASLRAGEITWGIAGESC